MSNAGGKKGGEKKRKNKKDCENVKCKFLVVFKPTKPKPNQNANCCKVITKSRSRPVSFPAVAFSRSPKSFTRGTSTEVISHGSVVFFPPSFGCRISISLRASFTTTFLASNGCNSIQPSRNTLNAGLNRCSRTLSGLPLNHLTLLRGQSNQLTLSSTHQKRPTQ